MIVWGGDVTPQGRTHIVRATPMESPDVLGDAKAWGFGHGVRQPRRPGPVSLP